MKRVGISSHASPAIALGVTVRADNMRQELRRRLQKESGCAQEGVEEPVGKRAMTA